MCFGILGRWIAAQKNLLKEPPSSARLSRREELIFNLMCSYWYGIPKMLALLFLFCSASFSLRIICFLFSAEDILPRRVTIHGALWSKHIHAKQNHRSQNIYDIESKRKNVHGACIWCPNRRSTLLFLSFLPKSKSPPKKHTYPSHQWLQQYNIEQTVETFTITHIAHMKIFFWLLLLY